MQKRMSRLELLLLAIALVSQHKEAQRPREASRKAQGATQRTGRSHRLYKGGAHARRLPVFEEEEA